MQVDDTQFPLVFLREHEQEHTSQQTQDQLEALLNRGQRFVLLTERLGGEDRNQEESHEDRKQRALFFKHNKQRLKDLCAGMVRDYARTSHSGGSPFSATYLGASAGTTFCLCL